MNEDEQTKRLRPLRILVADHHGEMRSVYTTALARMGHRLLELVETGQDLIDKCHELRPDLVISDAHLPDMDAGIVEQAVSAQRPVPFIVLTKAAQCEPLARSGDGRVLATLVKPVGAAQLEVQIPLVMHWFDQMESLRREVAALQQDAHADEQA